MSGDRGSEAGWWRRRKARRLDAPPKDHVFAAADEQLAARLRNLRLPEPPPALRDRSRKGYDDWLDGGAGHNRWRD